MHTGLKIEQMCPVYKQMRFVKACERAVESGNTDQTAPLSGKAPVTQS